MRSQNVTTRNANERGFVMILVLMLLTILMSGGLFGLKMVESDTRSFRRFNKNIMVSRAAAAGAIHRMAQIETAKNDPMSAVNVNIDWTPWPSPNAANVDDFDMAGVTRYAATSEPYLASGRPPAGQQVGSASVQTVIWEVRSYAVPNDAGNSLVQYGGEYGVTSGVKLVTSGSQSYNMD